MYDAGGRHIHDLHLDELRPGTIERLWLHVVNDKLGAPIRIPMLAARGSSPGPTLGLTAAIHGNELNGVRAIQRIFDRVDPTRLRGNLIGALVLNVPGYLLEQREFNDGQDLNRLAPGKVDGTTSQVYVHRVIERIVRKFDVHIDLHTASAGRINSHYVRADMSDPRTSRLARLQNPSIIVDNRAKNSTLRGSASALGIASITVELRDPQVVQRGVVSDALAGLHNAMIDLGMVGDELSGGRTRTWVCDASFWTHTDEGGILQVLPQLCERVEKGALVAHVRNVFGDITRSYVAPEDAIIVGRSVNPANQTGSRIAHFGINPREEEVLRQGDQTLAQLWSTRASEGWSPRDVPR